MHGLPGQDGSRTIDWGRTSRDYAAWRPDYPTSFYDRLRAAGVGTEGQRILDLGTGVGFVARELARRGARVTGVDVAEGQIAEARRLAAAEGLDVDFRVAAAEHTGLPDAAFDVLTASQCWPYFERDRMVAEAHRLLAPGGVLVTSHFCWLPREDATARASEALVLEHNSDWSAADWDGEVPEVPAWVGDDFDVALRLAYDEPIPFDRASWRGRFRACRGVGATLEPEEVEAFDVAHEALLRSLDLDRFDVLHRIDAHVLRPRRNPR
jgi:SAM-dependent methyltransferase